MSLSLFAAESLVRDFLDGRALPTALRAAVAQAVDTRLAGGRLPLLDETLCRAMDDGATAPPPCSGEAVVEAAGQRRMQLAKASAARAQHYATSDI